MQRKKLKVTFQNPLHSFNLKYHNMYEVPVLYYINYINLFKPSTVLYVPGRYRYAFSVSICQSWRNWTFEPPPRVPKEFSRLCTLGDREPTVGGCQKEAGKFRMRSGIWPCGWHLSLSHSHTLIFSHTHTHIHIQLPVIQSHTLSFLSNLACACLNVPGAISLWLSAWLKRHLRKSLLQMFPKCWLGFR